jgi:enoyl-CoA hydratase/carnithine racemase
MPETTSDVLLSERVSAQIQLLTLNRPDQLNTMCAPLCEALHSELAALADDRSCRAIVITGIAPAEAVHAFLDKRPASFAD